MNAIRCLTCGTWASEAEWCTNGCCPFCGVVPAPSKPSREFYLKLMDSWAQEGWLARYENADGSISYQTVPTQDAGLGFRRRTTREIKQSACRHYETADGYQHKRELQPMPNSSYGRWVWQAYAPSGYAGHARTDAQLAKRSTREVWPDTTSTQPEPQQRDADGTAGRDGG